MSASSDSQHFVVTAPFDDASIADIVLRSSDGVDFFASKTILALASEVFKDMIQIPKAPVEDVLKNGLPVVPMYESSAPVLDTLLRLLYPIESKVDDLGNLWGAALAGKKYEMPGVLSAVERIIRLIMLSDGKQATSVYLIASACRFDSLVREAAVETLKHPVQDVNQAMIRYSSDQSLADFWRLSVYRQSVTNQITSLFSPNPKADSEWSKRVQDTPLAISKCSSYSRDACRELDSNSMPFSLPWMLWCMQVLAVISKAPFAEQPLLSEQNLWDQFSAARCSSCRSRTLKQIYAAVGYIKKERREVVLQARAGSATH